MNRLNKLRKWIAGIWRYNFTSKYSTLLPREIIVNLTYRCNSRCIMCNIWRSTPKKEMSIKEWKKVIKDPFFSEIRAITISGGEPIVHLEFEEIAELLINEVPKLEQLSVITNGFLVKMVTSKIENLAKLCIKNKINLSVSVSLDGIDDKHYEVRRITDAFKKTSKTIEKLKKMEKKYGFNLNVGSVILKQNLNDFEKTKKWLQNKGINYGFQIVGFHENFVNNLETELMINFDKNDKKELIRVLGVLKKQGGLRAYYWQDLIEMYKYSKNRTTPCPFLFDHAAIDGLGNVFYCLSERPIGNFLSEKRKILDIYMDKKNILFRKNLVKTACRKCNSGCDVNEGVKYDLKKFLWFKLTGRTWRGFKKIF